MCERDEWIDMLTLSLSLIFIIELHVSNENKSKLLWVLKVKVKHVIQRWILLISYGGWEKVPYMGRYTGIVLVENSNLIHNLHSKTPCIWPLAKRIKLPFDPPPQNNIYRPRQCCRIGSHWAKAEHAFISH